MKRKEIAKVCLAFILFLIASCVQKDTFPVLKGPYLGQKPPGMTPEVFAPGIVSGPDHDFAITFSQDGKELLFTRRADSQTGNRVLYMKIEGGVWTPPQPAPFGMDCRESEPNFSPDGLRVYFNSARPTPAQINSPHPFNVWIVVKGGTSWGDPKMIGVPIMASFPMFMTQAKNGNVYFTGNVDRGIYKSENKNGVFQIPERLPDAINSLNHAGHPFIDPWERYLIFDVNMDDAGTKNLCISFQCDGGAWSESINLNDHLDFPHHAAMPHVTFDGKYLFFSSRGDIYWVDAKIIEELRPKR